MRWKHPDSSAHSAGPAPDEVPTTDPDQELRVRRAVVLLWLYLLALVQVQQWVERLANFGVSLAVLVVAVIVWPVTLRLFVPPRGTGTGAR